VQVLHPDGSVFSFSQSVAAEYDSIYLALPRFQYLRCALFYVASNEVSWMHSNSTGQLVLPSEPALKAGTVLKAPPAAKELHAVGL
jgi:hypothetical protein